MNPNMFGQIPLGQLPDVPSTEELWKDEKSKYRHWIILFGISIIIIFALLLTALILNAVHGDSIKESLFNWGNGKINFNGIKTGNNEQYNIDLNAWSNHYWKFNIIITQSVKIIIVLIGIILYFSTVQKAYKNKTFSHLSSWATMAIGIGALMGMWQLFSLFNNNAIFSYSEGIYDFILYILPIGIFIFVSRPVVVIKRKFAYSEKIESIKNSPQYQQMKQQMNGQTGPTQPNNMGPMGPMGQPFPNGSTPKEAGKSTQPQPVKKELTASERRTKELMNMKLEDLKEVAKKLSISGYDIMSKKETVEAIVRITENDK